MFFYDYFPLLQAIAFGSRILRFQSAGEGAYTLYLYLSMLSPLVYGFTEDGGNIVREHVFNLSAYMSSDIEDDVGDSVDGGLVCPVGSVSERGWPPCFPMQGTSPQAKTMETTTFSNTRPIDWTTAAELRSSTSSTAIPTTTPPPVTTSLLDQASGTPDPNLCGNGIVNPSNTSCFVEVFGEGFKICEDESAIKRLASGNFYALEECDDGNRISGDGCSETCSVESRSKEQNFLSHLLPTGNLHNSPVSEGVGGGEIEGFLLLHRLQAVDRVHPSTGWIQLSYGQNQLKTASYVKGIYRQVTGEIR